MGYPLDGTGVDGTPGARRRILARLEAFHRGEDGCLRGRTPRRSHTEALMPMGAAGWIHGTGSRRFDRRRRRRSWRPRERIPRHARRWRRRRPNPRTKTLHRVRARRALGGDRAGARAGVRVVRSGDRLSLRADRSGEAQVRVVALDSAAAPGRRWACPVRRWENRRFGEQPSRTSVVPVNPRLLRNRGGGGTVRADGLRGRPDASSSHTCPRRFSGCRARCCDWSHVNRATARG